MTINIYNKLCKNEEKYGILDTFLLGMCFILIPLQFSSIFLATNHYILLFLLLVMAIYWSSNFKRLKNHILNIRYRLQSIYKYEIICIFLLISSVILYTLFIGNSYDSAYYHYQNIRWNEEFSIIPGLANLEDRFGFNSNYFLLSAIFSFRFIFDIAITSLQSLLFILILGWTLLRLFESKYDIKYSILLLFLLLSYITN
ncbi:MAG: hypothetical protein LBV43_02460, partial [Prevotella sp.]|nr:hypothetical protein [Prevotella sp.]